MIGTQVSHYRITARLGEGGMGVVYAAVDELLDRPCAMKFLAEVGSTSEELAAEARAASRLNHPNVAQIYEYGRTAEGVAFIAMELVRGLTLRDRLRQGPMPIDEAVRVVRAVAEALQEAHGQGVMHLDIKTANIALTDRGVVKVLDFGLARSLPAGHTDAVDDATRTLVREWRGTPAYMSPEQARGFPPDRRSDLFSLGVVLYECLTGRRPFQGRTHVETMLDVVNSVPPPPSSIVVGLPARFDAIVQRLLAKDLRERYQSAGEVLAGLDAPVVRPERRRGWRVPAALVLAGVVAVAIWAVPKMRSAPAQEAVPLVVLPFENLTGESVYDAFSQGLAEVVTSVASKAGPFGDAVWVLPSNDVRRLGVQSIADAGRMLHAGLVVTGSVQREAGAYVIAMNLSNPTGPQSLGARSVRIRDAETGELDARLTTTLADLLGVKAKPAVAPSQPDRGAYARFVEGRGYLRQWDVGENLSLAITALTESVTEKPDFAPALVELSLASYRMYLRTHEPEWLARADEAAHKAQEIDDSSVDAHVQLGRLLRATGQFDDAIRELQAALSRDPKNLSALLQLGLVYEGAGRPREAEATYQLAIRLRPSYFSAYTNLGILYMNQGQYAKAEEPLALVVKLTPDLADPHTTLGSLYYHVNRLEEARREFLRSIELRPTGVAYANLCGVEFNLGEMDRAAAHCRQAVALDKTNAMAWGNLADALAERQESQAEAQQTYRKAIEVGTQQLAINAKNADVLASMSLYSAKTRQTAQARRFADQALAIGTTRVSVLYKAGKALGLSGECGRAVDLISQALKKGYDRQDFVRDPDVKRLRAGLPACVIPQS